MKLPWLEHGEHGVASIISSGKQRDMAKTTVASDQSSGRARTEEAQGKWHHSWQMENMRSLFWKMSLMFWTQQMKREIKWDHYYYHHVNIYIDVENPPFVDYFPRETMGSPHLRKRLPWRSYSWDIITKHVISEGKGWSVTKTLVVKFHGMDGAQHVFYLWLKIEKTSGI